MSFLKNIVSYRKGKESVYILKGQCKQTRRKLISYCNRDKVDIDIAFCTEWIVDKFIML